MTNRAKSRGAGQAQQAAAHLGLALLAFAALTLPTLQPFGEDDRWLGIGTVMLTLGLATWLRLPWLAPGIALVWALPFIAARLFDETGRAEGITTEGWAQLAGLLFLGAGVSLAYQQLMGPRVQSPFASRAQSGLTEGRALDEQEDAQVLPRRPRRRFDGLGIDARDAASLLERLSRLRLDLRETQLGLHRR